MKHLVGTRVPKNDLVVKDRHGGVIGAEGITPLIVSNNLNLAKRVPLIKQLISNEKTTDRRF